MSRVLAIAMMFALAVPTLAVAQENGQHPPERGRPGPGGPGPGMRPGGPPPGAFRGPPRGGPPGAQFSYRGHMINRVRVAPFVYPGGYGYRRWVVGGVLPPIFLTPGYYYANWAALGVEPPQPGFQWVRYGPDLLLVNVGNGQVVDAVYGAFY